MTPSPARGEATGFASFFVLIPAAGSGVRLGAPLPKQYLIISGRPVLAHTLAVFDALPECRGVVVATDDRMRLGELLKAHPIRTPVTVVDGGATRQHSVLNALAALPDEPEAVVLVHDAARPCVSAAEVRAVADAVMRHGAALLALPSRDTVKSASGGLVTATLDRTAIHLAQTPQGARLALLREAFSQAIRDEVDGTDEASLLERMDVAVHLVPGSPANLKITSAEDLVMAGALLDLRATAEGASPRPSMAGGTTEAGAMGRLVIVGTPIGEPRDLSPRAAEALRDCDLVVCEERKEAARVLRMLGLRRELLELNEHTDAEATEEALAALRAGAQLALVSDCGMPVFADPGTELVRRAHEEGITVDVVPGATSLTTALAVAGIDIRRFHFEGFLPAKREERARALVRLRAIMIPLVLMDAPYRLQAVLDDCARTFGRARTAAVACDLTLPTQLIRRGGLGELADWFRTHPARREFVIVVEGSPPPPKRRH